MRWPALRRETSDIFSDSEPALPPNIIPISSAHRLFLVLSSKRLYNQQPAEIASRLLPLISLPHLKLPSKKLHARAFDLYVSRGIDYIDAYNAALLELRGRGNILSFDAHFDGLPGVSRFDEPVLQPPKSD